MKRIFISLFISLIVSLSAQAQMKVPTRYQVNTPGTGNSCFDRSVTLNNGKVLVNGFFPGNTGETPTIMLFNPTLQGIIEWGFQFALSFMADVIFRDNTGTGAWIGSNYNGRLFHINEQGTITKTIKLFTNQSGYNVSIDRGTQLANGNVVLIGRIIDQSNNTRLYIVNINPSSNQIVASTIFTLNGNMGYYDVIDILSIGNYIFAALYDGNINNRSFLITSPLLATIAVYTSPFGYLNPLHFLPGNGNNVWMVGSGISGSCTGNECAMLGMLDLANPLKIVAYYLNWQVNYFKNLYYARMFTKSNFQQGTDILNAWGGQYDFNNGIDKNPFSIEFNTATKKAIRSEWVNEAGYWSGLGSDLLAFGCFNDINGNAKAVFEILPSYNSTDDCMTQSQATVIPTTVNLGTGTVNTVTNITLGLGTFTITPISVTPTLTVQCKHTCNLLALFDAPYDTCLGSTVQFTDHSVGTPGPEVWHWDFGDGSTSNLQNPSHLYTKAGKYIVKLIVSDDFACVDSMIDTIEICSGPKVGSFIPDPLCWDGNPLTFTLTDASLPGSCNTPVVLNSSSWRLVGSNTTVGGTSVNYTFNQPGNWTVVHSIMDLNGCEDSILIPLTVYKGPVASYISIPIDTACEYDTVSFFNTSKEGDAPIVSWKWDFDDGSPFSLVKDPDHLFSTILSQDYDVKLIVVDANGCSDSVTHPFHVNEVPGITLQGVTDTCFDWVNGGNVFKFSYTVLPGDNPIISTKWDFGDGGVSNKVSPTHKYIFPGTYNVKVCVTDKFDCEVCDSMDVTIFDGPIADFSATAPICAGAGVQFTDMSVPGDAPIISRFWNFGDGKTSNLKNPTHPYMLGGIYYVTLVVTDANGCSDEFTDSVLIYEISAAVSADRLKSCINQDITFTDNSKPPLLIGSVEWFFGDGSKASGSKVSHSYSSSGNYQVTAIVSDTLNSCQDTQYINIQVLDGPDANFKYNRICLGDSLHFEDSSLGAVVNWYWEFGDGDTSWLKDPVHLYVKSDTFKVFHKVWNNLGCWDTITHFTIVDSMPPIAGFIYNITGNTVQFTDTSKYAFQRIWYFGDGDTSHQKNPVHTYSSFGDFDVKLIVSNNCSHDSVGYKIIILGIPEIVELVINVYPNPNNGLMILDIQSLSGNKLYAEITDIHGKIIWRQTLNNIFGHWSKEINLIEYGKGVYLLHLKNENFVYTVKIMLM
jgi:PKD repeat protein